MASIPCDHCPKTFKTASGLDWHTDREHPEAAAENHQEPTDLSVPDHVVEDETLRR